MQRLFTSALLVGSLVTSGTAALAGGEVKIYPYSHHENYCPTGLQPVSINGVICCGVPTQTHSYQSAMSHPAHKVVRHARSSYCPVGTKGCDFD